MREEIKKKEMDLELNPDDLEQVSGGGLLDDLLARIESSGKAPEYKELLRTGGEPAAAAACMADFPELCGFCVTAVTMMK